jgi:hypothetical protein
MVYIDENSRSWYDFIDYVTYEVLGFCGCGDSAVKEDALGLIRDNAEVIKMPDGWDAKYFDLMMHLFDGRGITEHGTSVMGSWLNKKGLAIRSRLIDEGVPREITT